MLVVPKHSILRPSGTGILMDPALPREVQMDYKQCIHCQAVWKVEPGSGKMRGFCGKCNGPICGPKCLECNGPFDKQNDDLAAGRPIGSRLLIGVPLGGKQ
jgi:hypothetical protein